MAHLVDKDISELTDEQYLEYQRYIAEQYGFNINKKGEIQAKPESEQNFSFYATDNPNSVYSTSPEQFIFSVIQQANSLFRQYNNAQDKSMFLTVQLRKFIKTIGSSTNTRQLKCVMYPWLYYILKSGISVRKNASDIIEQYLGDVLHIERTFGAIKKYFERIADPYYTFVDNVQNSYNREILLIATALIVMWNEGMKEKDVHKFIENYKAGKTEDTKKIIKQFPRKIYNINNFVFTLFFLQVMAQDLKYASVFADKLYDGMEEVSAQCSDPAGIKFQSLDIIDKYLKNVHAIQKLTKDAVQRFDFDNISDPFNKFVERARKNFTLQQFSAFKDPTLKNYQTLLNSVSKLKTNDGFIVELDPANPSHVVVLPALGFLKFNRDNVIRNLNAGVLDQNDKAIARYIDRIWGVLFEKQFIPFDYPFTSQQYTALIGPRYTFDEFLEKVRRETNVDVPDTRTLLNKLKISKEMYDDSKPVPDDIAAAVLKMDEIRNFLIEKKGQNSFLTTEIETKILNLKRLHNFIIQRGVPVHKRSIDAGITFAARDPVHTNILKQFSKNDQDLRKLKASKLVYPNQDYCKKVKDTLIGFRAAVLETVQFESLDEAIKAELINRWRRNIAYAKTICTGDVIRDRRYIPEKYWTQSERDQPPTPPPPPPTPKHIKKYAGKFPFPLDRETTSDGLKLISTIYYIYRQGCSDLSDKTIGCPAINRKLNLNSNPRMYAELAGKINVMEGIPENTKNNDTFKNIHAQSIDCIQKCQEYYQSLIDKRRRKEQEKIDNARRKREEAERKQREKEDNIRQRQRQKLLDAQKRGWDTLLKNLRNSIRGMQVHDPTSCNSVLQKLTTFEHNRQNDIVGAQTPYSQLDDSIKQYVVSEYQKIVAEFNEACKVPVHPDLTPEQQQQLENLRIEAQRQQQQTYPFSKEEVNIIQQMWTWLTALDNQLKSFFDPNRIDKITKKDCEKMMNVLYKWKWRFIDREEKYREPNDPNILLIRYEPQKEILDAFKNLFVSAQKACDQIHQIQDIMSARRYELTQQKQVYLTKFNATKTAIRKFAMNTIDRAKNAPRDKINRRICNSIRKALINIKIDMIDPGPNGFLQILNVNDEFEKGIKDDVSDEWEQLIRWANQSYGCEFNINHFKLGGVLPEVARNDGEDGDEDDDEDDDEEGGQRQQRQQQQQQQEQQRLEQRPLTIYDIVNSIIESRNDPLKNHLLTDNPILYRQAVIQLVRSFREDVDTEKVTRFVNSNYMEAIKQFRVSTIEQILANPITEDNVRQIKRIVEDTHLNNLNFSDNEIFQYKLLAMGIPPGKASTIPRSVSDYLIENLRNNGVRIEELESIQIDFMNILFDMNEEVPEVPERPGGEESEGAAIEGPERLEEERPAVLPSPDKSSSIQIEEIEDPSPVMQVQPEQPRQLDQPKAVLMLEDAAAVQERDNEPALLAIDEAAAREAEIAEAERREDERIAQEQEIRRLQEQERLRLQEEEMLRLQDEQALQEIEDRVLAEEERKRAQLLIQQQQQPGQPDTAGLEDESEGEGEEGRGFLVGQQGEEYQLPEELEGLDLAGEESSGSGANGASVDHNLQLQGGGNSIDFAPSLMG